MKKSALKKLIKFISKSIDDLIFQKKQEDEKLEEMVKKLQDAKDALQNEIENIPEETLYFNDFGTFFKSELDKQKAINNEIENQEKIILKIVAQIQDLNIEKKKYETLIENIEKIELEEEKKAEMKLLDEFAVQQYLRDKVKNS